MVNSSVKSAERTLEILELLGASLRPVPTMAISRACRIPKSSTHHLLNVMRARGWVTYYATDRGWGLGAAAFETGSAYLRSQPVQRLAHPLLLELTAATGVTSHLAVLRGDEVEYVDKVQPPDTQLRLVTAPGVRLPAHLTAVGLSMLAWLSAGQVRATYVRPLLGRRTDAGPRTLSQLLELLEDVRRRGYAIELGMTTPGIGCIAAAALSHEGYPIATIGLTFVAEQYDERARLDLAAEVSGAARRLSNGMGVRWRAETHAA